MTTPPRKNRSGDPIDYLRRRANYDHRTDSDDEGIVLPAERLSFRPQSIGSAAEEPPARGRPSYGEQWPYRENLSFTRNLVFYGAGSISEEHVQACKFVQEARSIRQFYHGGNGIQTKNAVLKTADLTFAMPNGVAELYDHHETNVVTIPSIRDFEQAYKRLEEITKDGAMRSFCFQRLQLLSTSFKMYVVSVWIHTTRLFSQYSC